MIAEFCNSVPFRSLCHEDECDAVFLNASDSRHGVTTQAQVCTHIFKIKLDLYRNYYSKHEEEVRLD